MRLSLEYMDSWERFDETSLPDKEAFYSELNLEDITDKDYEHAQKVWEVFGIKNLGDYHDLYVQSDTLLLADVFENFRDKCIEIHGLDPAHFLSAPGLAWQACLKKTKVKLELLTNIDMLWRSKKELEAEFVKQYIGMLKKTINIWRVTIKTSYIILKVFRCKQLVWMGNITKTSHKWFKMGRKVKIIKI